MGNKPNTNPSPNRGISANSDRVFCSINNGVNMTTDRCKIACSEEANAGWCDVSADNYCKNVNSEDNFCGCINSTNSLPLLCVDPACNPNSGSYITTSTRGFINACLEGGTTVCNAVINCQGTGECKVSDAKINQICGSGKGTNPPVGPGTSGSIRNQGKNSISASSIVMIIVFIIIIIVLIIIIIVYSNSDSKSNSNSYQEPESIPSQENGNNI